MPGSPRKHRPESQTTFPTRQSRPRAARGLAGEAASHLRAHCMGRETPTLGLSVFQACSRWAEPSPRSRGQAAVPIGSPTPRCSITCGESQDTGLQPRPRRSGGRAPAPADNVSSGGYLKKPANPSNTRCFLQKRFYIHIKTSCGDFLILMNFSMK